MQRLAGLFPILIKRMAVDVQRRGRLRMTQQAGDGGDVGAARDQEALHLIGEVDIPVAGGRFRLLDLDVFAGDLDHVAADVELAAGEIEVTPLEAAAFAPPDARGNEQLEIRLILDVFLLQRTDEPYNCFFIRNGLFFLLACIPVRPPSRVAEVCGFLRSH